LGTVSTRFLVTGASGFVGEHLARRLAAEGAEVTGTYWSHPISIPGVAAEQVDLGEPEAAERLVRRVRPQVIFHTAAWTDAAQCQANPEGARRSIVAASGFLAAAAARLAPDAAVVALSTDLVYDGRRGLKEAGYTEADEPGPLSTYAKLKLEAEGPILSLESGCVLRTSLVYGAPATHRSSFLGWMLESLQAGRPITLFQDEYRTPILVDDLCGAMEGVFERRLRGLWLAGGEDRLSRLQMGEVVCDVYGLPRELLVGSSLSASTYGAPRPGNTALDSRRLWNAIGRRPRAFREGVELVRSAAAP
jgi:dTDP-4-dehydrorhamnose reductase